MNNTITHKTDRLYSHYNLWILYLL